MKTILIIEDEKSLIRVLSKKLENAGYKVHQAMDGQIGLETALREHPDLILLDVIMPVMDGMTALKQLRKDDWGRDAKVIMLTNLSDANRVEGALKKGVHDFLVKSDWKLDEVLKKVRETLG
jgi:CheY-like chemotaxis protein